MANLVGLIGAVAVGVSLSQFPEFTQQYQQRLGGAVDELRIVTQEFDQAAADQNLTRDQAMASYTGSTFLETRAYDLNVTFIRYDRLSEDLVILESSDAYERARYFYRMTDTQLIQRTWDAYAPAVPVTPEGFVFAGGGAVLGYMLFSGLFSLIFRRRRGRENA